METKHENAGVYLAKMESFSEKLKALKEHADFNSLSKDEIKIVRDALVSIESKSNNLMVNIQTRLSVPESLVSLRDSLLEQGRKQSVEMDIVIAASLKRQAEFGIAMAALDKTNRNIDAAEYYNAMLDLSEAKCNSIKALYECTLQVYSERISELESSGEINPPKPSKTTNAHIGNLKKRIQELTEGYEGAANLAHAITKSGPQRGVNPWTEEEIVDLAGELGVSIKGDCLKAFKAGMPADLVKKDAGARPITPREESPDDVGS